MERSNAYYIVRSIVRGVFYLATAGIAMLILYAFILGAWATQF
jgi:hypothetical protein